MNASIIDTPAKLFVLILCVFYFFSGLASLAYEIIWMRLLVQQFGVSHFGVAATVAAFMLGLGLGSFYGRLWLRKLESPMYMLAALEAAIGLYAISLSFLFAVTGHLPFSGWVILDFIVEAVVDMLILLPPAFAMGAGFPLILSLLPPHRASIAYIYGANTLGAVVGALLPLYLLPAFGWFDANRMIAVISLALALVALTMHRKRKPPVRFTALEKLDREHRTALWVYGGIGFATLMIEVCWSRLFGLLFLRTEYILGLIIAIYLFGMAVGSFIARFHRDPKLWLTVLPMLAAAGIVAGLWLVPQVALWSKAENLHNFTEALAQYTAMLFLVCFPVSLLFGAWLPLLQQRYFHEVDSGAALYAVNSIGAGAGAFAAGFIFIPLLGTTGSMILAAFILLLLGVRLADYSYKGAIAAALLVFAVPVWHLPTTAILQAQTNHAAQTDLFFSEDALSITHVVEKSDGQRLLLSDLHRMDAASDPVSVASQKNQCRLPMLLYPEPKQVLLLGLGTGISAAALLNVPDIKVKALELSSGAIQAARGYFAEINDHVLDKIEVERADIRRELNQSRALYDVIIGDLFHPDRVGRATLLSLQHFKRVKEHLNQGGLFVQWLALNQFDLADLKVVLRTFEQVFPGTQLYLDGTRLALAGSRGEPASMEQRWRAFDNLSVAVQQDLTGGEGFWTWMGRGLGRISVEEGPLQDQWRPVLEFQLPRARFDRGVDVVENLNFLFKTRPTVDRAVEQAQLVDERAPAYAHTYTATDLQKQILVARIEMNELLAIRLTRQAYDMNPLDRWIGFALADLMLQLPPPPNIDEQIWLDRVLSVRGDHMQALHKLYKVKKQKGDTAAQAIADRMRALHPYEKI